MKERSVQPEILDGLPAAHPDAIRSRRDLRLINFFMGNERWLRREVERFIAHQPNATSPGLLELGAGAGHFSKGLMHHRVLPAHQIHAVDLVEAPSDWPAGAHWHQGDLFSITLPAVQIITASLFLHHFEGAALHQLSDQLPETVKLLLFTEPERRTPHLWQGRLLHLLFRLNHVTRHDLRVSVEAGFRDQELVSALGLHAQRGWQTRTSRTLFGAHRVIAWRS